MNGAVSKQPFRAQIVMRNERGDIEAAQNQVLNEIEQQGYGRAALFAVRLSLEEALCNAFKHGNKNDASKTVKMHADVGPDVVAIEIVDQGIGFDPDAVPDPTENENVEIPCGRGLKLIRSFMHEVEIVPPGNCIRMKYTRAQGGSR